jgi:hypothetical protein
MILRRLLLALAAPVLFGVIALFFSQAFTHTEFLLWLVACVVLIPLSWVAFGRIIDGSPIFPEALRRRAVLVLAAGSVFGMLALYFSLALPPTGFLIWAVTCTVFVPLTWFAFDWMLD